MEDYEKLVEAFIEATGSVKVCSNCSTYGWCDRDWKQTKQSTCSQCGWTRYCSKVCQLEHWKKVHSKHCKFLAGKAVKKHSRHSKDTCSKCTLEIQAGKDITRADNPHYPCYLEHNFLGISDGFKMRKLEKDPIIIRDLCIPLGEMSGQYLTKHEKHLAILQQILAKISAVYTGVVKKGDFFPEMNSSLAMLRMSNWQCCMVSPTEEEIDYQMSIQTPGFILENGEVLMNNVFKVYNSMMKKEQQQHDGDYKWWSSFLLFLELIHDAHKFYRGIFELQKLSDHTFDKFGSKFNLKEMVRSNNFLPMWEALLTSVSDQMLPFQDLINMLCDGQVERVCQICAKKVTIVTFYPQFHRMQESASQHEEAELICKHFVKGKSFVSLRPSKLYCCESKACAEKVDNQLGLADLRLLMEGIPLAQRFEEHRCDTCFMVNDKGHRCSGCKTKVYCSLECRDRDWGVHRLCCEELVGDKDNLKRKKKGDTEKRRDLGRDRMNNLSFGAGHTI